ncbi:hypothetical protein PV682_40740 [Streptomyces niveiscabiei]|uniref:hypothetical protein n=1 Tax=Streptomyces niveiscabiei TaxID=164115 RepID=UPI0029B0196F|nr:hypothetical protein [Streptomyces niveiscabiei]MDX3387729.1 hypothetical protein [Streptomyces niveiscabiei]
MLTSIDHVQLTAPPGSEPLLRVTDIEAYAARFGDVAWDDGLPGHIRFYASDPVGNRLEFLAAMPTATACGPGG